MLGLFFFISTFAFSIKLASHLWSSGIRCALQYEQSQPLHLKPKRPTFFLQIKHLEWSACLDGGSSGISGILNFSTYSFMPCAFICYLG